MNKVEMNKIETKNELESITEEEVEEVEEVELEDLLKRLEKLENEVFKKESLDLPNETEKDTHEITGVSCLEEEGTECKTTLPIYQEFLCGTTGEEKDSKYCPYLNMNFARNAQGTYDQTEIVNKCPFSGINMIEYILEKTIEVLIVYLFITVLLKFFGL